MRQLRGMALVVSEAAAGLCTASPGYDSSPWYTRMKRVTRYSPVRNTSSVPARTCVFRRKGHSEEAAARSSVINFLRSHCLPLFNCGVSRRVHV